MEYFKVTQGDESQTTLVALRDEGLFYNLGNELSAAEATPTEDLEIPLPQVSDPFTELLAYAIELSRTSGGVAQVDSTILSKLSDLDRTRLSHWEAQKAEALDGSKIPRPKRVHYEFCLALEAYDTHWPHETAPYEVMVRELGYPKITDTPCLLPSDLIQKIQAEVERMNENCEHDGRGARVDRLVSTLDWARSSSNYADYGPLREVLPTIPTLFYEPLKIWDKHGLKNRVVWPTSFEPAERRKSHQAPTMGPALSELSKKITDGLVNASSLSVEHLRKSMSDQSLAAHLGFTMCDDIYWSYKHVLLKRDYHSHLNAAFEKTYGAEVVLTEVIGLGESATLDRLSELTILQDHFFLSGDSLIDHLKQIFQWFPKVFIYDPWHVYRRSQLAELVVVLPDPDEIRKSYLDIYLAENPTIDSQLNRMYKQATSDPHKAGGNLETLWESHVEKKIRDEANNEQEKTGPQEETSGELPEEAQVPLVENSLLSGCPEEDLGSKRKIIDFAGDKRPRFE